MGKRGRRRPERSLSAARRLWNRGIQKLIELAREHPLKTLSLCLTGVVVSVFLVSFGFTSDVFVDDVVITDGVASKVSYNGVVVTQAALADVKAVAERRANDAQFADAKFLDVVEVKSDRFSSERVCNGNLTYETSKDLFTSGIQRATMSSSALDEVLTGRSASIRKFAFAVRERLGHPVRELRLFLGPREGNYEARIEPFPPGISAFSKRIDSLDRETVSSAFAELLTDALLPEVMAVERMARGAKDYERPKSVARNFLQDEQKELLIRSIEMATRLESSRTYADMLVNYKALAAGNEKLLKTMDFSRYGKAGDGMKLLIIERLIAAEPSPEEGYKKYVTPIAEELSKSFSGNIWLATYEIRSKNLSAFDARLEKIFSYDSRAESNGVLDQGHLHFLIASLLMGAKEWDRADKHLAKTLSQRDKIGIDQRTETELRALRAVSSLHLGNPAPYASLSSKAFNGHYCAEAYAIGWAYSWVQSTYDTDKVAADNVLSLVLAGLNRIAANDIRGFGFFNFKGSAESLAKNWAAAEESFKKALQFEGDHAWALLNWGKALLDAGRPADAKIKYKESLSGTMIIPAAVDGLLRTLYVLNEHSEFLTLFNNPKFGNMLAGMDYKQRSTLQAVARISSCREKKPLRYSILKDGEAMVYAGKDRQISNLNSEVCEFVD